MGYEKEEEVTCYFMTEAEKISYLESQYNQLKAYQYKRNEQILFNLIQAKVVLDMHNYKRSLYLDVKKFVENYIKASDKEDYGYDEILPQKIMEAIEGLEVSQKLSILYTMRRMMIMRGYDADSLQNEISSLRIQFAWLGNGYQKCYAVCLWLSSQWWTLLISYIAYIIVLMIVLLPAPLDCMQMFEIDYNYYSDNGISNCIMNTLALLTGNDDIAPTIKPIGIGGLVVYILGKILFYLIIGHFVYRKIEDYIIQK